MSLELPKIETKNKQIFFDFSTKNPKEYHEKYIFYISGR